MADNNNNTTEFVATKNRLKFSTKLRNLRVERGYTLHQFSKIVGYSVPHLCEMENDKHIPSKSELVYDGMQWRIYWYEKGIDINRRYRDEDKGKPLK